MRTWERGNEGIPSSGPRTPAVSEEAPVHFLSSGGNIHGVSTHVLIRVLSAAGHRAEVPVKKAAA